ncbi:MAG: AlpA family transcriptional regulator [Rhizobacter sp.]|nr:AlpA family transcriptional regulator [Rhizobacter sp.]
MRISNSSIYGLTASGHTAKPSSSSPHQGGTPASPRAEALAGQVFIPKHLLHPPGASPPPPIERYLRRREVCEITGLATSTLYRLMNEGLFMRPHTLGPKCVGWPESAVRQWCAERKPR